MSEQQLILSEAAPPQGALFDYQALDAETRIVVQQRTGEIQTLAKRATQDMIEIGRKLAECKDRFGDNGRFTAWLAAEFGWSERTAYNFIAVYVKFGQSDIQIANIATSALYLLASPSTPPAAIEKVKLLTKDGEKLTHTVVKTVVKQAKADEERAKGALFEEADEDEEAICLCGCKASDHPDGDCKICTCEMYEEATGEEIANVKASDAHLGPDGGEGPVVEVSQEEADRMKTFEYLYFDDSKPVKVCYAEMNGVPEPFIVLDYQLSEISPLRVSQIEAWPILPIAEYGEDRAISYDEWLEHEAEKGRDYTGVTINVGLRKKPEWWAIAGPKTIFKVPALIAAPAKSAPASRDAQRDGYARLRELDAQAKAIQTAWRKSKVYISLQYMPAVKSGRKVFITIQAEGFHSCQWVRQEADVAFIGPVLEYLEDYKRKLPDLIAGKKAKDAREAILANREVIGREIAAKEAAKPVAQAAVEAVAKRTCEGTPFPTEHSKEEIGRIAGFYCSDKISDGKPVKICYVLDQPFVITGTVSSSKTGTTEISAWPVLPIANVGEANTRTYREVSDEYYDRLRRSMDHLGDDEIDEVDDSDVAFSYQNIKINCGSPKKPNWWVMVGPQITFTVIQEADDFTADRCQECHRIDGAHTPDCELGEAIPYEVYRDYCKAGKIKNPAARARKLQLTREEDATIRVWLAEQNKAMAATASKRL